jgi:hypothetical protein
LHLSNRAGDVAASILSLSASPAWWQIVSSIMIKFLANIFRGLSFIFGVTAPPPGEDERPFVFMWVGIFVFVVAVVALLFYVLSNLHLS